MARHEQVLELLSRVCRAQGLPVPTNFGGSIDQQAIMMLELLTEVGRELNSPGKWQLFDHVYNFTTTPPTLLYDVPEDLEYFETATGWNNTARIPLIGPMTPQEWALLQARQLGGTTLYMQFQVVNDKIEFYFVPDDPQDISIGYQGRGWVLDEDLSTYKDHVENDGDVVLYDPLMMELGVIDRWRERKGFDTGKSNRAFLNRMDVCLAKDIPGRDLHTSRQSRYPYLGLFNLPDTGYGSSS